MTDELVRAGYKFTILGSVGGFLQESNATLLVGCQEGEIEGLKAILAEHCHTREQMVNVPAMETGPQGGFISSPVKVTVGGAVMFVLPVEEFARF